MSDKAHFKVILIVGLPGSGKTHLAITKYVPLGYTLVDDPSKNASAKHLMVECMSVGNNMVITDPRLCDEKCRKGAISTFRENNYKIEWVFFENDETKCRKLLLLRNDNRVITSFEAFNYTIPKDVVPVKIYEKQYGE